jgi:cytochrome b involved in lipid metabolism
MKKSFAAVVVALVLSVVVAPGSSAAVKAGAACKKAGQSTVAAGMKYTCVKKGSKLVWGKGVAVKAAPVASASAAPSQSAAPVAAGYTMAPKPSASATPIEVQASKSAAPALPSYTLAKVKENNSASNCWTIINSNVYDLTKWAAMHPGGPAVIRGLCGIDGTAAFTARHRNQSDPEATLDSYLVGTLAK